MTSNASKTLLLRRLYYDIGSSPSAFAHADLLYRTARKTNPSITRSDVREFLDRSYTSIRHTQRRAPRARVPIVTTNANVQFDCDTMFYKQRPVLVCADAFSSRVFAA